VLALALAAPLAAADFQFSKLNRTYTQLVDALAPIVLGPVEVLLRSPEHRLDLVAHRAVLEPADDGTHTIRVEIDLSGMGMIDAVLRTAGLEGKLQDELTLPRQTLSMTGRIGLAPGPDGYVVTLIEAPEQVEVRIESRLAGRLVPLCRQMALVLVRFDCVALEESLTRVQVPIPEAGTQFVLPAAEMTGEERDRFDTYLEHSRRHCCRR
jgi:hypothetical protein